MCVYVCMYACIYVCMHVCLSVGLSVCLSACMYVCMYPEHRILITINMASQILILVKNQSMKLISAQKKINMKVTMNKHYNQYMRAFENQFQNRPWNQYMGLMPRWSVLLLLQCWPVWLLYTGPGNPFSRVQGWDTLFIPQGQDQAALASVLGQTLDG